MIQPLEARTYLSAPVLDAIPTQFVPAGKTLQVPLTAASTNGDALTYSVSADNSDITTTLHPSTNTWLKLGTSQGTMTFELFDDIAPKTVAIMKGLVESGFFNGTKFHRIVKNFVIQGGDPNGNGSGGPGFQFDDEFDANTIFSGNGQLAMANAGKDTNGSQFFVTKGPQRFLDFNHTIWGQLVRGFSTFNKLLNVPVQLQNPTDPTSELSSPITPQKIKSATIITDTTDAVLEVAARSVLSGNVTVKVADAHGQSATQVFNLVAKTDTANEPPILSPISDMTTPKNKSLTFALNSVDPDGGDVEYAVQLRDTLQASASVEDNIVTFTPKKNFTGAIDLTVGVKTAGATTRGSLSQDRGQIIYDTQSIRIGVGDQPAIDGQAVSLSGITDQPLSGVVVGTFDDSDPTGSLPNWSAAASKDPAGESIGGINWGDGTVTSGTVVASQAGGYAVTGSHTYENPGEYPLIVAIDGDKGARLILDSTALVQDFATESSNVLRVSGTSGNDVIAITSANGQIIANLNGASRTFDASTVSRVEISAAGGADRVTIGSSVPGAYIDGGSGNDTLIGGDANDTLTGGAGKNILAGGNGDDRLNGSGGRDALFGGNGNDRLYGNGGNDTLQGGNGVDRLFGGSGDDLLIGDGSNDKLYGQDGNDTLQGNAGSDLEDGGAGIDVASNDGTDVLVDIETQV